MEKVLDIFPVWPDFKTCLYGNGLISREESGQTLRWMKAKSYLRLQNSKTGLHYFLLITASHEFRGLPPNEPINLFYINQATENVLADLNQKVYFNYLYFRFGGFSAHEPLQLDSINPLIPNETYFRCGNPHIKFQNESTE